MAHIRPGDAVSTGVRLGLGLAMSSYMFQAMKPPEASTRQVLVCLNCRNKNSIENKCCWHCGQPIYPLPQTQCSKCKALVSSLAYCGNCGTKLRKTKQREKKENHG